MGHGIEKPYDKILSVEGTEWHGLADVVEAIGEEEVSPLFFDIIESPAYIQVDGKQVNLDNYKVLVADHRKCRDDLEGDNLVPLHIPKSGYQVIDNRAVWDVMATSLKDIDAKITSVGTLERGKKFFISTDIGDSEMVINKDKFKCYLNFVTSHDGSVAMYTYDSIIRIVCMNTFQWSMEAAGDVGFKVYHTKNASLAMNNLGELVNAILKGRAQLVDVMKYLETCKVDANEALAMATGYFCLATDKVELSSRCHNAANEISYLFARGVGNKGQTLYDLANGATEYWTSGAGTGKTLSDGNRLYRSAMGTAASHKQNFIAMLANDDRRKEALRLGKDSLALAASNN